MSAATVSPQRRRLGLAFDLLDHNLATEDFELFVERLLRKIRGPITMVIDRLGAHKSAAKRLLVKDPARLAFEWLPPYSPDLNPTQHVWGHTKYSRSANFIPDDLLHLGRTFSDTLRKTRREQRLLRSFFRQAELDLEVLERTIHNPIVGDAPRCSRRFCVVQFAQRAIARCCPSHVGSFRQRPADDRDTSTAAAVSDTAIAPSPPVFNTVAPPAAPR